MANFDRELLNKFNAGDKEAFEIVFRKFYSTLCFFANKFIDDAETTEDVVQDVFLWFYEKKPEFGNLLTLKSYLYSSVHNKCLNVIKKDSKKRRLDTRDNGRTVPEQYIFETAQLEAETFEQIFRAVDRLPEQCARVFRLSYIERHDIKTVAEKLNISENTVKVQRQKAKKLLRESLKHLYQLATFIFF